MSKLINNKSDSSKVKVSLISEEARGNWKLFGCYATWLMNKTKVSMSSQTLLSQISVQIQIFISLKASSFWKGIQQSIQQVNYCSKISKIVGIRK